MHKICSTIINVGGKTGASYVSTFFPWQKIKISKTHYRWRLMVFWVQSCKKVTEWIVDGKTFAKLAKVVVPKILHEENAHHFFSVGSIVHWEFNPESQVINATYYTDIMKLYLKRMNWVTLVLYQSKDWSLLHENAPLHKTETMKQFLTNRKFAVLASSWTLLALPCPHWLYSLPETQTGLEILVFPVHNAN